jgi:hypothetical protein
MAQEIDLNKYDRIKHNLIRGFDEADNTSIGLDTQFQLDYEARLALGREKMEPLIEYLDALKKQVGVVGDLDIRPVEIGPEMGHIVIMQSKTSGTTDAYSISTNFDNSKYTIEAFRLIVVDGSFRADIHEFDTVVEVMIKILNLVGEHIVAKQPVQKGALQ